MFHEIPQKTELTIQRKWLWAHPLWQVPNRQEQSFQKMNSQNPDHNNVVW